MGLGADRHVLLEVLLDYLCLAASTLEWALDGLQWAGLLVLLELRSSYILLSTVVRALDRIVGADSVMAASDDLEGVLQIAVLALDSSMYALLTDMILDVFPSDSAPTLVRAWNSLVGTALGSCQVAL